MKRAGDLLSGELIRNGMPHDNHEGLHNEVFRRDFVSLVIEERLWLLNNNFPDTSMNSLLLFPKMFLAGGVFLGAFQKPAPVEVLNHTLPGIEISSSQVVCRSRWGTPMPPDGKAGYSLIAPIRKKLIEQSLWIPPVSGTRPVASSQ